MVGGGRGGPVVFPHPDDDNDAGRLLDKVGSTNKNDDDNNDTPSHPPKNDVDAPWGEGCRDDDGVRRQRDGGGGEQGCGRNERDERDDRDRSLGSA